MHISFTFKNFEPSEHLRKYARRRLEKLGRFLGKNPALDTQVLMTVDKFRQKVEVQIAGEGLAVSASESSEDMYATIDLVLGPSSGSVRELFMECGRLLQIGERSVSKLRQKNGSQM